MSFEILDHTADVKIRFFGNSKLELLSSLLEAWVAITGLTFEDGIQDQVRLTVPSSDPAEFLYLFSNQLISLLEAENFYCKTVHSVTITGSGQTDIIIHGLRFLNITGYSNIPKAPTYHELEFSEEKGFGQIIFDL